MCNSGTEERDLEHTRPADVDDGTVFNVTVTSSKVTGKSVRDRHSPGPDKSWGKLVEITANSEVKSHDMLCETVGNPDCSPGENSSNFPRNKSPCKETTECEDSWPLLTFLGEDVEPASWPSLYV